MNSDVNDKPEKTSLLAANPWLSYYGMGFVMTFLPVFPVLFETESLLGFLPVWAFVLPAALAFCVGSFKLMFCDTALAATVRWLIISIGIALGFYYILKSIFLAAKIF